MILTKGLVIYCGEIEVDDVYGKMKKININFEPQFDEIKEQIYHCDSNFYVKPLLKMLKNMDYGDNSTNNNKIGFIIINGDGCLFAVLIGNNYKTLCKMNQNLRNKHKNGGQSQKRFARLRKEARNGKRAEMQNKLFSTLSNNSNQKGLIFCGNGSLNHELLKHKLLNDRLKQIVFVKNTIDTRLGDENELNHYIDQSVEILSNIEYLREKELLQSYMDEIGNDGDSYFVGINHLSTTI